MFPIYIAEFEFRKAEDDARSFTLVIDAHDDSVRRSSCTPLSSRDRHGSPHRHPLKFLAGRSQPNVRADSRHQW